MIRRRLKAVEEWFMSVMRRTSAELGRRERVLKFMVDVVLVASRQMRRDRAEMMAAALTYRLLFALMPLMVIAAGVMQLVVSRADVVSATHELVSHLQLDSIQVNDSRVMDDGSSTGNERFTAGSWVVEMADRAMNYDTSGITIIGTILLVYSAVYLFREIETTFSTVSGRGRRRSWWRRWGMYLAVLSLGPLLLVAGLWMLRWGSMQITDFGSGHVSIVYIIEKILSCLLIWGLITIGYLFIPANRLRWRTVAPGALVATVALFLAHWGFRIYVERAVVGSPAGSLALVPLFLFWVYLNWTCLLFGLQCAAVSSRVAKVRRGRQEREAKLLQ